MVGAVAILRRKIPVAAILRPSFLCRSTYSGAAPYHWLWGFSTDPLVGLKRPVSLLLTLRHTGRAWGPSPYIAMVLLLTQPSPLSLKCRRSNKRRVGRLLKRPAPRPTESPPPLEDKFSRDNFRALVAQIDALKREKAKHEAGVTEGVGTSASTATPCRAASVSKGNKMHLSLPPRPSPMDHQSEGSQVIGFLLGSRR